MLIKGVNSFSTNFTGLIHEPENKTIYGTITVHTFAYIYIY